MAQYNEEFGEKFSKLVLSKYKSYRDAERDLKISTSYIAGISKGQLPRWDTLESVLYGLKVDNIDDWREDYKIARIYSDFKQLKLELMLLNSKSKRKMINELLVMLDKMSETR